MSKYDSTLTHVVQIDFILKRLYDDGLVLAAIELIEAVSSVAFKRLCDIIFGQAALNFEDLTHQINDSVIEVENYDHGIRASLIFRLVKVLSCLNMVKD